MRILRGFSAALLAAAATGQSLGREETSAASRIPFWLASVSADSGFVSPPSSKAVPALSGGCLQKSVFAASTSTGRRREMLDEKLSPPARISEPTVRTLASRRSCGRGCAVEDSFTRAFCAFSACCLPTHSAQIKRRLEALDGASPACRVGLVTESQIFSPCLKRGFQRAAVQLRVCVRCSLSLRQRPRESSVRSVTRTSASGSWKSGECLASAAPCVLSGECRGCVA